MRFIARRCRLLGFAVALTPVMASCHSLDTTRQAPPRGTLGEEVFGVLCARVGTQSLPEDLDGHSFRAVCEKSASGTWGDKVDVAALPVLVDGATRRDGSVVPLADQQTARNYAIARIEALGRR